MGMVGGIVVILGVLTLVVAVRILQTLSGRRENDTDETRIMEEMSRTMTRLEERVKVLETLLKHSEK